MNFDKQIAKLSQIYKSKATKHKQFKTQRNYNEMKNKHNNNNNNNPHHNILIDVIEGIINSTSKSDLKQNLTKQIYKHKPQIKLRKTLSQIESAISTLNTEITKNTRTIHVIDKHISKETQNKSEITTSLSTKLKELHNIEQDIISTNNQYVLLQSIINTV